MRAHKEQLAIPRAVKLPVEVQVSSALRESIISGAIPAGSRVTEVQISEQMSVSRATTRAALHQLAKEGLLTLVPYTGWTVILLTARDVWELYTSRSAIERLAAQLSARSMTEEKAGRLASALEDLRLSCEDGGAASIAEADFALHKTIICLSDHSRLLSQYELIEQQIRMYIRSSDALVPELASIMDQHKPIVDAILEGDAARAGNLSEEHNLSEGAKLSGHLQKAQEKCCEASTH